MSATMVGHLEHFGHLEKNIFDHNFVTNCDINTIFFLTISTLQMLFDKSLSNNV